MPRRKIVIMGAAGRDFHNFNCLFRDFVATTNATPADFVVDGTPIELSRILTVNKPVANVAYELEEVEPGVIEEMVRAAVSG
jgi:predicted GTPase